MRSSCRSVGITRLSCGGWARLLSLGRGDAICATIYHAVAGCGARGLWRAIILIARVVAQRWSRIVVARASRTKMAGGDAIAVGVGIAVLVGVMLDFLRRGGAAGVKGVEAGTSLGFGVDVLHDRLDAA